MNKKSKKFIERKTVLILCFAGVLLTGILVGMTIQQMLFTISAVEIGESLEGTTFNIEVDINETKLVEGIKEAFLPVLNETRELLLEEKEK